MNPPVRLFMFGAGYTARAFARSMRDRAAWIGGTTRTPDGAARLAGITPFLFDGNSGDEALVEAVRQATHVVVAIPPGENDPVLAALGKTVAAAPHLRWIGYLSTVGVYGNYAGAWVTERTTPHPATARARQRVAAEKAWRALGATPVAILRIAGIYGPGRNAFVKLAEGRAHRIVKSGQVFNRIHVDDLARALHAALEQQADGVFNVADDEPAAPQEVVARAAAIMGIAPPPEVAFDEADLSPMARSFYADNKRVSNRRLKDQLGIELRYPTYRDGLAALWKRGDWRGRSAGS